MRPWRWLRWSSLLSTDNKALVSDVSIRLPAGNVGDCAHEDALRPLAWLWERCGADGDKVIGGSLDVILSGRHQNVLVGQPRASLVISVSACPVGDATAIRGQLASIGTRSDGE